MQTNNSQIIIIGSNSRSLSNFFLLLYSYLQWFTMRSTYSMPNENQIHRKIRLSYVNLLAYQYAAMNRRIRCSKFFLLKCLCECTKSIEWGQHPGKKPRSEWKSWEYCQQTDREPFDAQLMCDSTSRRKDPATAKKKISISWMANSGKETASIWHYSLGDGRKKILTAKTTIGIDRYQWS